MPLAIRDVMRFPDQLAALVSDSFNDRDRRLAQTVEWIHTAASPPRHVSIEGEWAAGKSRFAAQIARSLYDQGSAVRFASGSPSSLAYEGVMAALPELRPTLEDLAERLAVAPRERQAEQPLSRAEIEQTVLWNRGAELVERLSAERPLTIVIDDADQLDSPSSQLLAFLLRGHTSGSLTLLTASLGDSALIPARGSCTSRRTERLDPLGVEAIAATAQHFFPHALPPQIETLAEVAMQLSGGLPSLVRAVLHSTEPDTLEPPATLRSTDDVIASLLDRLRDDDVMTGAAVAVLGQGVVEQARLGDIAALVGRTADDTLESLDRLTERGLLLDGPRPDAFRVRHSPAALAFLTTCTRSQLRSMHAAAVSLSTTSHRRAHHLVASLPAFDLTEVVAALEESATDHLARGAVQEALDQLTRADTLSDGGLSATSRGQMAVCLSRLGRFAEADAERSTAFAAAAEVADWEEAVSIVLAGQHDDIVRRAQPERLNLLGQIPSDQLTPRSRGRAAAFKTILAAEQNDLDRASSYAREAHEWIDDRDRHELARAEHFSNVFAHPSDRLRRVQTAFETSRSVLGRTPRLTDAQQLTVSQLVMIDRYELGDTQLAVEELERFEHLGVSLDSVRAQWHAKLMRSMLAMTSDDRDAAERLSAEAHALARRFALVGADEARLAQQFFAHWIDGTHGKLLPLLLQIPESILIEPAQAATALALLAADRIDEPSSAHDRYSNRRR